MLVAPSLDKPGQDKLRKNAARLGIVASRKVGNAVERNRAKRLLRDLFRRHLEAFPQGTDVVIIVRPGTHKLSQAELDHEVLSVTPLLHKRKAGKPKNPEPAPKPKDGRNRPPSNPTKTP